MIREPTTDEINSRWEKGEGGKHEIQKRLRKAEAIRAAGQARSVKELRAVLVYVLVNIT